MHGRDAIPTFGSAFLAPGGSDNHCLAIGNLPHQSKFIAISWNLEMNGCHEPRSVLPIPNTNAYSSRFRRTRWLFFIDTKWLHV